MIGPLIIIFYRKLYVLFLEVNYMLAVNYTELRRNI